MYLLRCFTADGNELQVTGVTRHLVFEQALEKGAVQAIDWNGEVYTVKDGAWKFGGTSLWTQVAGDRAGSPNFSLINPPR